ncbi:MAG: hypothetical protein KGL39_59810 [Patescibacteria group bacterium]|nr:hypothetical protein [Patescibacteria group bacterium]
MDGLYYVYTTAYPPQERYWNGRVTTGGVPSTVLGLASAVSFQTARQAYAAAGEASKDARALLRFRVGRRPRPVSLRAAA